jgi:hypothetical protein
VLLFKGSKKFLKALRVIDNGKILGPEDAVPAGAKLAKKLSAKRERRKDNAALKKSVKEADADLIDAFQGDSDCEQDPDECNNKCLKCCNSKRTPFPDSKLSHFVALQSNATGVINAEDSYHSTQRLSFNAARLSHVDGRESQ